MDKIIIALLGVFLILGIIRICFAYVPLFKERHLKKKFIANKNNSSVLLQEISNEKDVSKIVKTFVLLLRSSYVLLHIMVNEGNKYDDKLQTKLFCESLNSDVIKSLNSLEGKYE